jgi:transcriptional regulator with XRE-family HTH domain
VAEEPDRLRRALAAELGYLRQRSGLSGRALARELRVSQPTVHRIETGVTVPNLPTVRAWLDVTEAPTERRDPILAMAEALAARTVRWSELLSERPHLQDAVAEREAESVLVRNFQPTVIAGLLQTPAYARALMPLVDPSGKLDHEATVAARIERQRVLYEPGKRFEFLISESALRWSPGEGVMAGQRDRLTQLTELSTVEIAVLPFTAQVAAPWHNFVIFTRADDSRYVTTELIHGTQRIEAEADVTLYAALWERLWAAALRGPDATTFIREQ